MATRDELMRDIADMLGTPIASKGVGSSVHNDFIDPVAVAVLGPEIAGAMSNKYRKTQSVIEVLGGTYVRADPNVRNMGDTSEGTKSDGGGTLTNKGLAKIRDLILENGVPAVSRDGDDAVADFLDAGYDPHAIVDTRRKRLAAVASRPGATKFRDSVRKAYGGQCCISGSNELAALEAAHIAPYQGVESDVVSNALLLRADLHKLHDALLLAVSDDDLTVLMKPRLLETTYAEFAGTTITSPKGIKISVEALRLQRDRCGL